MGGLGTNCTSPYLSLYPPPVVGWVVAFLFQTWLGAPLEPKWILIFYLRGVCLLLTIPWFSLSGHPHCLAIILDTQTTVEMVITVT